VLQGDVIIRGSGDPGFGYPSYEKDNIDPLRTMARRLKSLGINQVTGSVIGDATIHDQQNYGPAWPLDTGMGAAHYAPTVSGLPYQRNMLWVEPNGQGPNGFVLHPDVPEIPVVWQSRGGRATRCASRTRTPCGFARHRRRPGPASGVVRAGDARPRRAAPGDARGRDPGAARSSSSARRAGEAGAPPPLAHAADMVPQLNQHSDNFFAEHFWKGGGEGDGPGELRGGRAASANFFHRSAGCRTGSSGRRTVRGSRPQPHQRQRDGDDAEVRGQGAVSQVFHESLAVAGDPRGTMKRMFVGTAAAGNLHAKTGYIRQVRSLSGYVKTASGERVAFAFIYNGRNTSGARGVQTNLGNLLATYRR
jgi:D-alanyl-D-alanine carboxypeptidase/D-alanyl-D-alanine-endopeptidase (penicillin-binding protein 4)